MTFLGLPNAGKSSLLNKLVGEELAIVTPKAQTTRQILKGYVIRPGLQLVVTDTPGLQEGTKVLNQALSRNIARAIEQAQEGYESDPNREQVAAIIDAADLSYRLAKQKPTGLEVFERSLAKDCGTLPLQLTVTPLLNKSDGVKSPTARLRVEEYVVSLLKKCFQHVSEPIWISARSGEGVEEYLSRVQQNLPESGESVFEEEELSDQPLRHFAAEFVREQCFLKLGEELPYSIAVQIEEFDESREDLCRIEATLHVERDSQKAIVIGKGGEKIKVIGSQARTKLENFLNRRVYLGLKVKVSPYWTREAKEVEKFGYGSIDD